LTNARFTPLDRVTGQVAALAALELDLNNTSTDAFFHQAQGRDGEERRITGNSRTSFSD
jgi:hypothetical protein